jgi:hypothetical protein
MIAPTKYASRTVAIRHVNHPKGPHSDKTYQDLAQMQLFCTTTTSLDERSH